MYTIFIRYKQPHVVKCWGEHSFEEEGYVKLI